jgi:hypothetical protein
MISGAKLYQLYPVASLPREGISFICRGVKPDLSGLKAIIMFQCPP